MNVASWPVFPWPAQPPSNVRCAVFALPLPVSLPRTEARAHVRQAARAYIATRLGCTPDAVQLQTTPGQAPQVVGRAVGLSFSHEPGCSLVAVHWDGPVGVDLMQVALPDDWAVLTRDYLGAAVARRLADTAAVQRTQAFSQAWTELEAGFKLRGEALREWQSGDEAIAMTTTHRRLALALPQGFVGSLALQGG